MTCGWQRWENKNTRQMPKLQSLPPTSEAFLENVKRAHLQTCIWKSALEQDPPDIDATSFGWSKDLHPTSLNPVMMPDDIPPAPAFVLKLICCGCSSQKPCETGRCGCYGAHLPCTAFCNCFQTNNCKN